MAKKPLSVDSSKKKKAVIKKETPKITPLEFFNSVQPKPEYVKHVIECKCFLPQYKNLPNPVYHQFVVFSELDGKGVITPSYAECNNCGLVHRVIETYQSSLAGKESSKFVPAISDIEMQIPERLAKALREHECELHVWQEAKFILEHELWGRFVVLSKEKTNNNETAVGKICQIIGRDLYKIEVYEREEFAKKD